ncbi:MAG: LuxR C-terminal-related transcriptional regulator [Bryobacterales bacterium]
MVAQLADTMLKGSHGRLKDADPAVHLTPRSEKCAAPFRRYERKEVAAALDLSPRTVEFHRYNITDKLGVKTLAELARYAVKHGIVAP